MKPAAIPSAVSLLLGLMSEEQLRAALARCQALQQSRRRLRPPPAPPSDRLQRN